MNKLGAALFVYLLGTTALWAQQVPSHSVPIGRGPGVTGFNSAPPGTAGQFLISNGPTADPTFQTGPTSAPSGPYAVTGGSVSRADADRWVDNPIDAREIGVDCTGDYTLATANSTALQNFFDVGGIFGKKQVMFPLGCVTFINTQINIASSARPAILGPTPAGNGTGFGINVPSLWWNGLNGGPTCPGTYANCQFMFRFLNVDNPIIMNISFRAEGNDFEGYACPDGFLSFDGDGGSFTPTRGFIQNASFANNGNCRNPNFTAIDIARTSTNNNENYVVRDVIVNCGGGGGYTGIASDVVTNGTTTVTSASAPFLAGWAPGTITGATWAADIVTFTVSTPTTGLVNGDFITVSGAVPAALNGIWFVDSVTANTISVFITKNPGAYVSGGTIAGQTIELSYAYGSQLTTIATFVSTSNVTVASAPAFSQVSVRATRGQLGYGIGIRNGASQNAIQQIFSNVQYSTCNRGILLQGGGAYIFNPTGGASDVGVEIGGFLAQNTTVDFYASESDKIGILVNDGAVPPITISNGRFSNGNQPRNGFIQIGGSRVFFYSNTFNFDAASNGVLIGGNDGVTPTLTSINNQYHNMTWTRSGLSVFTQPPPVSINDTFDGGATVPGSFMSGCSSGAEACFSIRYGVASTGGTLLNLSASSAIASSGAVTGVKMSSTNDLGTTFTGYQSQPTSGRVDTAQTLFEAAWNSVTLNVSTGMSVGYGFRARTPTVSGGTLANVYGLYVDQQKATNVTNGWGVFQADTGDKNAFLGGVQLGVSSLLTESGTIGLAKITDPGTAPGIAGGKILLRCGTNVGTARLVAYAGNSTTPVTILDNIGGGVTGC